MSSTRPMVSRTAQIPLKSFKMGKILLTHFLQESCSALSVDHTPLRLSRNRRIRMLAISSALQT